MAELAVLGSGTGFPTKKRSSPGLALINKGSGITLIDPGPGAVSKAAGLGLPLNQVDLALLTHLHLDHTLDLAALFFARDYLKRHGQLNRLRILGPRGLLDLVNRMQALYGEMISPEVLDTQVEELEEGALPGIQGEAIGLSHGSHSALGYRLNTDSGTLAVSGDSDFCDGLIRLGTDADLFVLECSFPKKMGIRGHLSPESAARVAGRTQPKKLLLYHLYPQIDEKDTLRIIRGEYAKDVRIAEDNKVYSV